MGRVVWNIMATNFMLHKRFCEKSSGISGLFTYYVKILYLCDGLSECINIYIHVSIKLIAVYQISKFIFWGSATEIVHAR